jgi:putative effector of murein hydrolase LrgA (UPF0299 family)
MTVKFYHIFSIWIFLASILYGLHVSPMNPFPLLIPAAIVGTLHLLYRFALDPWWKLTAIFCIHFLPFLWIRPNVSITTLYQNMGFLLLYLVTMAVTSTSILDVYWSLFTKPTGPFLQEIKEATL